MGILIISPIKLLTGHLQTVDLGTCSCFEIAPSDFPDGSMIGFFKSVEFLRLQTLIAVLSLMRVSN